MSEDCKSPPADTGADHDHAALHASRTRRAVGTMAGFAFAVLLASGAGLSAGAFAGCYAASRLERAPVWRRSFVSRELDALPAGPALSAKACLAAHARTGDVSLQWMDGCLPGALDRPPGAQEGQAGAMGVAARS